MSDSEQSFRLGTHVFTAMERSSSDTNMRWSVVSLDGGRPHGGAVESHGGRAGAVVATLIHAIVNNYATNRHPKVRQWLARHPRWTFHFTSTSASWLNAVEGFFAKLTRRRLKRGVFRSVVDLQVAINRFVAETNADPKPFAWTRRPKACPRRCQTREANVRVTPLGTVAGT